MQLISYRKKILKSQLCITHGLKLFSTFFNIGFDAINFGLVLTFQNMLLESERVYLLTKIIGMFDSILHRSQHSHPMLK